MRIVDYNFYYGDCSPRNSQRIHLKSPSPPTWNVYNFSSLQNQWRRINKSLHFLALSVLQLIQFSATSVLWHFQVPYHWRTFFNASRSIMSPREPLLSSATTFTSGIKSQGRPSPSMMQLFATLPRTVNSPITSRKPFAISSSAVYGMPQFNDGCWQRKKSHSQKLWI